MHEPQQNKTFAKDIDRGRPYVKKGGVNVDKYEIFEKIRILAVSIIFRDTIA